MPPLSAYTPFESLLFFQSLAALDARPANFASISDGLRNNRFVRENVAFDAGRLAPEALEDLYATLTRDGFDEVVNASSHQLNGRHEDSPSSQNTKKRKISSPRPDGLAEKGIVGHAGILPEIVSHLYARYRELVTKEIKTEERKYNEIRDELERLKQEREKAPAPVPTPVSVPKPAPENPAAKQYSAPEPMDVDTQHEISSRPPAPEVAQSSSAPKPSPEIKPPALEPQTKEVETPKQPTPITPRPSAPQNQQKQLQPLPPPPQAPPVKQSPKEQPKKAPPQPSPLEPYQQQPPLLPQPPPPNHAAQPFQALPPNGQPSPASQPPTLAPRDIPTPQGPTNKPPLAPQVPSHSPPGPPVGALQAPAKTAVQPPPIAKPSVPSPAPKKTPQTAKAAGKESATPTPKAAQRPPSQPTIQQWSLNQPPQTPQPPSHPKPEPLGQPPGKPLPPPSSQQTPKLEPKKAPSATPSASVPPSTPLPAAAAAKPPAPSGYGGYETPVAAAHALLQSQPRASLPRLSIDTSGSVTPWKKTSRLTLPHSPRSPDRPRPEDVSPISEKAPSLMGSREATPEDPEPPRRKRRQEAKGSSRGREPSPLASDVDNKAGPKSKSEKPSFSANKRRDQSTASSRSRGRSVLSREDEAAGDPPGRIKREMPSTPSGVPDVAEAEPRASGGRKSVAAAASEEQRPGRGRPKRKRAPSEAFESEPPQPEISQLSRIDPNQSTPYVLCARSFPKTGQAIMNNVTTHKHASVFSKPLTERDAPGYRDLIYRPQDLKSIKSSITQGSKALAAATEAVSTPVADGESPIPTSGTPSKNSVLMLQKSEDVIPPKGIVNSAQLEKELIRMFSNATMFNPIPQRGFGPSFPMVADGESRESTIIPEPDEGGIIKATHEMFEDVEKAVTGWRQAERTSDEMASKSILSLRRGSASDLNTDSADEVKG